MSTTAHTATPESVRAYMAAQGRKGGTAKSPAQQEARRANWAKAAAALARKREARK